MTSACPPQPASPAPAQRGGWGVDQALPDLRRIWSLTRGSSDVCIAVLDGPIDAGHPCFEGARLRQLGSGLVASGSGSAGGLPLLHGTHVASLIFGQHSGPFRGVAPRCRGVIIPVFGEDEQGVLRPCSQTDLARGISLALAVGADVISISGGQLEPSGQAEPVLARGLELCARQGVLVVAAAGNDGCRCVQVPAAAESVLAVGAMDQQGQPLASTNWGEPYREHGLLAPGGDIRGAIAAGRWARLSGTSPATALVAGVAALLMSVPGGQARRGADAVRRALLDGARPCRDLPEGDRRRCLAGRLDITNSLRLLFSGANPTMSQQERPRTIIGCPECPTPAPEPPGPVFPEPPGEPPTAAMPAEDQASAPRAGRRGEARRQLVYALGLLDYDLGSDARRDAFIQQGLEQPGDRKAMLAHLQEHPCHVLGLTWTLVHESVPVYAIMPGGPFAAQTHQWLCRLLHDQLSENLSQVAVPGVLANQTRLLSGQRVPVIEPDIRGMFSWSTQALINAVLPQLAEGEAPHHARQQQEAAIENFLNRIYYELRNLGIAPQERAVNFAATNLKQVAAVYGEAIAQNLKLDRIEVERSSICRQGSDCWDVKLTLFDPAKRQERAREVFRLTIDVSEVLPVTVGKVRRWSVY